MLLYRYGGGVMEIYINDQKLSFLPGESILEVARKHHIYIPTLCHLPKLAPVGACRMCVVEEDNGNIIASCKSPARPNIRVHTHTPKLQKYRQEIMQFLCINHPLECGVCDKSGECELQDKVLETKIPLQTFSAEQREDELLVFQNKIYDESLCILCERCARTCNQIVGNNYLKVITGGYHSKIGINAQNYCEDCDECVSVCPTGAMISQRFQYKSNAWELEKTASSCTNCALGCYIVYEVKSTQQTTHLNQNKKIYRSTTQMEFTQLCHSGRHHFAHAPTAYKDDNALKSAIDAFKNAKAIRIGTQTTNEEALILSLLQDKLGLELYCEEARVYHHFTHRLKSTSQSPIYRTKDLLKNADVCISIASFIFDTMPVLKSQISKAITTQNTQYIYLHPIPDMRLKKHQHIQYEVNTELGVVALMLAKLVPVEVLDTKDSAFIQNLDIGYLSSESNVGEEEINALAQTLKEAKNPILLVGSELFYHAHSQEIAYMLGLIEKHSPLKIITLSPSGNAVGISLICKLCEDSNKQEGVIGYRERGEYALNPVYDDIAYKDNPDFAPTSHYTLPALTQIEGSFVNTDYALLPLVPSLPYEGYDLCDIAQHFGLKETYLIELTHKLPTHKGFKNIAYDDLLNHFDKNGTAFRGYDLDLIPCTTDTPITLTPIDSLPESNGSILYIPELSGNFFTLETPKIFGSHQFKIANKLTSHQKISFKLHHKTFVCEFIEQDYLKGMVAIFESAKFFITTHNYPYEKITPKPLELL
ncbi:hypothetical protein BKH46_04460 [Helicobacter sp. 12S02634-8]|uniref:2Fe-2S iron-sulfur cluster-binding protein n=1 Tax=Helicobacter sp. 12S02634-8 TaxID=1476199 RepID=UPI000BCE8752|nr:2Fe-2S iron-sulfur cluster-binding protein [Helicobacter sp. 12S02634-8]PAF47341.1 hypothetical protein BKH46_04460 [Helicobacter sp. 12S02634-8]